MAKTAKETISRLECKNCGFVAACDEFPADKSGVVFCPQCHNVHVVPTHSNRLYCRDEAMDIIRKIILNGYL